MDSYHHIPVLKNEILSLVSETKQGLIIDCTLGEGGHSEAFLAQGYSIIALERDKNIAEIARNRLEKYNNFTIHNINFSQAHDIFENNKFEYDLVLFDLGISMFHYRASQKGFSFMYDENLDMRLDGQGESAADIVNGYAEDELVRIFREYGEEPFAARIARRIIEERKHHPVQTAASLRELVRKSKPVKKKIDPATQVFQALRIKVNNELMNIEPGIESAASFLKKDGKIAVISYHSLEDRIVKNCFRKFCDEKKNINKYRVEAAKKSRFRLFTKKPIIATREEQKLNPASRSAKMRILTAD